MVIADAHAGLRLERPDGAAGRRVERVDEAALAADEQTSADDGRLRARGRRVRKTERPLQRQLRHLRGGEAAVRRPAGSACSTDQRPSRSSAVRSTRIRVAAAPRSCAFARRDIRASVRRGSPRTGTRRPRDARHRSARRPAAASPRRRARRRSRQASAAAARPPRAYARRCRRGRRRSGCRRASRPLGACASASARMKGQHR